MKSTVLGLVLGLAASTSMVSAEPVRWATYSIPQTRTSVDFPASIFTEEAGRPNGYGQRFRTADGRADLTIQAAPNVSNDSPAAFLAKKHPPARIQYKRVTPRFFAVSSYKGDKVWYDRCNFSGGLVHCILINYPAREEHDWDDVVTRISLSLNVR
ncbi:ABC transporter permease [Bradyrhizobium sp. 139]|uniref:ABC transporter permease n=1 Tax=Bradyrhizobium sp. 139 TaxID=2782616 RepID=UPI001FF72C15|nr:ABC transporter permease [Bradyrhizobium sp. 139]MCK1744286.1 ABC transporter permease [Bradyrhizobium sp. 139]